MEAAYNAYSASDESSCFSPYLVPCNTPLKVSCVMVRSPSFGRDNTDIETTNRKQTMTMHLATSTEINALTESAGEIRDNRFAVINGVHLDLTSYSECADDKDYHVITVYEAGDCHNISHASDKYMSKGCVLAIHWSHDEEEATEKFLKMITALV